MESKNVKVIDEHGIDRNANIICSIDVDGSDYVVYWIERDSDNDNIFVSKALKNNDGTSNMVNIEDTMEKSKISDIVKELITYAINNEENKLSSDGVNLPSGKKVGVSSVLINKEQNISVQKTYITTVKKTVTKVSDDFYTLDIVPKDLNANASPAVSPIFQDIVVSAPEVVAPVPVPQPVSVLPETEIIPQVTPVIQTSSVVNPVSPVIPEVKTEPIVTEENKLEAPVTPVIPVIPVIEQSVTPVAPVVEEAPVIVPTPVVSEPVVELVAPVIPEEKTNEVISEKNESNKLIFDGSKETNLNVALGEVSAEKPMSVNNVEPIREFGVDEQKVTSEPVVTEKPVASEQVITDSQKGGFANNKFFMVVAITFFVASCVFLGYEVFQYFQIK